MKKYLFALSLLFCSMVAFAADVPDTGTSLLALISAVKVGTGSAIILAVVQLLKSNLVSNLIGRIVNVKYIPWITIGLGVLGSVGMALGSSGNVTAAIIEGVLMALISNGVFDQIKVLGKSS